MVIHLGRDFAARKEEIVALTDLQKPLRPDTASLIEACRAAGTLLQLADRPKTLVLLDGARGQRCVLSGVGIRTLRLRADGTRSSNEVRNG